jgi:hypothetical protein
VDLGDVLAWPLCRDYPPERVRRLFAGRPELTPTDLARLTIPAKDRVWALLCAASPRARVRFARDCAEQYLYGYQAGCVLDGLRLLTTWLAGANPPEAATIRTVAYAVSAEAYQPFIEAPSPRPAQYSLAAALLCAARNGSVHEAFRAAREIEVGSKTHNLRAQEQIDRLLALALESP